jgi:hypothetical protein
MSPTISTTNPADARKATPTSGVADQNTFTPISLPFTETSGSAQGKKGEAMIAALPRMRRSMRTTGVECPPVSPPPGVGCLGCDGSMSLMVTPSTGPWLTSLCPRPEGREAAAASFASRSAGKRSGVRPAIRMLVAAAVLQAAVPASAQVPPPTELEPVQAWVQDTVVTPDDVVTVHGTGWDPESQVEVVLDGRFLVSAGVGRDGRFSRSVAIPNDVAEGDLTLTVSGTDAAGQETEVPIPLTAQEVAAPGIVLGLIVAVAIGAVLLIAGLLLLWQRRRRTLTEDVEAGHMPVRNPEPGKAPQPKDADSRRR